MTGSVWAATTGVGWGFKVPFARRKQSSVGEFNALDVSRGECTVLPKFAIPDGYAAEIVNFKLVSVDGSRKSPAVIPVTRPGLSQVTNSTMPDGNAPLAVKGSATKTVVATKANLYYLDANNDPQPIGAHEAGDSYRPVLINYAGLLIVLDGGYPKYWDEASFNLLYDVSGYEFDYRSQASAGTLNLYAGGKIMAGQKETTPTWAAGLTLPTGPVVVSLSKTGAPTGSVTIRVYDDADNLVATSDAIDAASLTTSPVDYTFTFSTAYMRGPSLAYTYAVHFSGGDAANYVSVEFATTASGGGVRTNNGSTWTDDATKDLLIGLRPSLPPKARWGVVHVDGRLHLFGDPDNTSPFFSGSMGYYSALPDEDSPGDSGPFNWGGGALGGAGSGSYGIKRGDGAAVTGACLGLGGIVISKGPEPSRMFLLTGASPGEYALTELPTKVSAASGYAMVEAANNVYFIEAASGGLMDLVGVQTYGDVKYRPLSWPVDLSAGALDFAAAYGVDDQILIKPAGSEYAFVYHIRLGGWTRYRFGVPDLTWDEANFTWDEWTAAWGEGMGIDVTGFGSDGVEFYVCAADGHVYRLDQDSCYDGVVRGVPSIWSKAHDLGRPHNTKQAKRLNFRVSSRGLTNAVGAVAFRRDLEDSDYLTKSFRLPADADATWDDLDFTWHEWDWPWGGDTAEVLRRTVINFNFRTLQVGIQDVSVLSAPLEIDGVFLEYAVLGEH